jgi:hypothetical protein
MDIIEGLGKEIAAALLPVLIIIAKVAVAGGASALLSQQSVEWIWNPVAGKVGGVVASGSASRRAAMVVGIMTAMAGHYAGWPIDFGAGPKGWVLAALAGFFGGGLAAPLRDWAATKWFVPTRTIPGVDAAGGGS